MEMVPWVGWLFPIACAIHAFSIAKATHSVAERKWYSHWYGMAVFPVVALVLAFLIRAFVFEPFRLPSESMRPTVPEGSYIFVSKAGFGGYGSFGITIWRGEPTAQIDRGDIVALRLVEDPRTTYVKRVIGLPGDRIEYVNRRLVINHQAVPIEFGDRDGDYQYAVERRAETEMTIAHMLKRPPNDFTGLVPRDHLIGRVVKILPPAGD